jgi:hypothetical protein
METNRISDSKSHRANRQAARESEAIHWFYVPEHGRAPTVCLDPAQIVMCHRLEYVNKPVILILLEYETVQKAS